MADLFGLTPHTRRRLSRDPTERQAVGVSVHGRDGRVGRDFPVRRARRPRRARRARRCSPTAAALNAVAETTPRAASARAAPATPAGSDPTAAAPPPAVDDLSYFNRLEKPNAVRGAVEAGTDKPARQPPGPPAARARRSLPQPATPLPIASDAVRRRQAARRTSPPRAGCRSERAAQRPAAEPSGSGFAVQIAALNVRSEADAIAKRLARRATPPTSWRRPTARRRCFAFASASSRRGAKPKRLPPSCRKKSSSSPGSLADALVRLAAASGAPPRAQLSQIRSSRVRLDRARAAAGALGRRRVAILTANRVSASGLTRSCGVVYFTGTLYWITRVMAVYGGLQTWVAVLVNAALIAYLALFPAFFAVVVRRIVGTHGPLALMAAPLVWVATELGAPTCFTGFPVGAARVQPGRPCCRSRSSRACSASTACRRSWPASARRWR